MISRFLKNPNGFYIYFQLYVLIALWCWTKKLKYISLFKGVGSICPLSTYTLAPKDNRANRFNSTSKKGWQNFLVFRSQRNQSGTSFDDSLNIYYLF